MHFIGLLLVALALFLNLKSYGVMFKSKNKIEEDQKKFEEAFEKVEENEMAKKMSKGVFKSSLILTISFNFVFYLITSAIVANPFMYALAVIIFLLNVVSTKKAFKAFETRKLQVSKANIISLPLKTAYIICFFVLFFL